MKTPLYKSIIKYSPAYFIDDKDGFSFYLIVSEFENYIEVVSEAGPTTYSFNALEKTYPNIIKKARKLLLII